MNYSKKEVSKKQKKLKGKNSRGSRSYAVSFIKFLTATFLIVVALCLGFFAAYASRLISECPDINDVDVSPDGFLSHVYDVNGKEIETLAATGANREYVKLDKIPVDLQHAFVAIEDRKFYTHNGIDPAGIVRAGFTGLLNGGSFSQGASTITQQLLKNNFFSGWTSENSFKEKVERKIQEQYMAVQLEKVMTKDNILENYLNTINLGQNTLGVEAAAERYFSKEVSQLTLSESAVIAGITQNPTKYNPILHPDDNKKRRKKVLDDMLAEAYITQDEYDNAMQDDVYARIEILNSELESGTTTYFVDALCEQVINDLVEELGLSETEAYNKLYSGGLKIYSTQNPEIQAVCDREVNNQENYGGTPLYSFSFRLTVEKPNGELENYSEQTMLAYYQHSNSKFNINYNSEEEALAAIEAYKEEIMEPGDTIPEKGESINITLQPQVAISIIDQTTGQVPAIVGGRGDKTASRTLNRATGITRQPGSTFKIVASYAPALDAGGMTLASTQDDSPMEYANGTPLRNYDNQYRGWTSIRTAITHSINVVAVKTLTEIGTGLGLQYAEDLGITTLQSSDNVQALALGGITYGVKNIDLAAAYATIANGGNYNRPNFYTRVEDFSGTTILDTTDNEAKEVLKPTTAWLLTSAMKDVMTQGTGTPANFPGMTLAGKSGTTTSNRDTVFAGFSPYYTCTIWGGFDDNAIQKSTSYSKTIWKAIMKGIHEGLEDKDFERPADIVEKTVCTASGKLPVEGMCTPKTEFFAVGTEPTEPCDKHTSILICPDSGLPVNPYCPAPLPGIIVGTDTPQGPTEGGYNIWQETLGGICSIHFPVPEESSDEVSDDEKKKKVETDIVPDKPKKKKKKTDTTDESTNTEIIEESSDEQPPEPEVTE